MTIEQVETEALKLDPQARAKLAERLLRSLDDLSDEDVEQLGRMRPLAEMRKSIRVPRLCEMPRMYFVRLDPVLHE